MMRTGTPNPVLALVLLAASLGAVGTGSAAEATPFSGTVRDSLGNVLSGVEVLLVQLPARQLEPTAVARSDGGGRFRIDRLLPGPYRIAALKDGYDIFVGQVNTLVQGTVDLVLQPVAGLERDELPDNAAWALRLPRRGMLHELEGEADSVSVRPPATQIGLEDLSLELEQLFSSSAGVVESRPDDTHVLPSQTRVTLQSPLGGRGELRLRARRERSEAAGSEQSPAAEASRQAGGMQMDFVHDAGTDAQLAVNAHYGTTAYQFSDAAIATGPLEHEQQAWGYDARWSKQIDPASRFAVGLDYTDVSVDGPVRSDLYALSEPDEFSNRAIGASGSYRRVQSSGHDIDVGLRAQRLTATPVALVDPPAWTLRADLRDSWSVTAPLVVILGLGTTQAFANRDATLMVPRLGARLSYGGWSASTVVSYHALVGEREPFLLNERVGYEADLQLPLGGDVRLRGGTRFAPIQPGYFGFAAGAPGRAEGPIYLTDGNAAVREHSIGLFEEGGTLQAYFEITDGGAEGTVTPLFPLGVDRSIGSGQQLRYRNGRFGVVLPRWGTDLVVEYQWMEVTGDEKAVPSQPDTVEESVELRVKQSVSGLQIPGDWRLLMAVRLGIVRAAAGVPSSNAALDALNQRLSAGVSVLF